MMNRDYRRMLEKGHEELDDLVGGHQASRLEYLSDHIFDFTTYDSEIAKLFARKALEVCAAINDAKTFEYIKDADNYRWYLLMCNMPFFYPRLSWGGSIRGAWWDVPTHKEAIEFSTCGLFLDGEQITEPLTFTRDQWREFIAALLAFGV